MTGDWKVGVVAEARKETPSSRRILLDVAGWGGNLAGQHLDLRLTAPDGYAAVRSYSVASAGPGDRIELAVDRLPRGEVSPYLVDELLPGDELELRGPLGGWFVWKPDNVAAVQLVAGGSGIVPLMAMIRSHADSGSPSPFRLLYSVRTPADVYFASELDEMAGELLEVSFVYTRSVPKGWPTPAARLTLDVLRGATIPPTEAPAVFVCGPTGFVESVATWLVQLGHDSRAVRTERFGGN